MKSGTFINDGCRNVSILYDREPTSAILSSVCELELILHAQCFFFPPFDNPVSQIKFIDSLEPGWT